MEHVRAVIQQTQQAILAIQRNSTQHRTVGTKSCSIEHPELTVVAANAVEYLAKLAIRFGNSKDLGIVITIDFEVRTQMQSVDTILTAEQLQLFVRTSFNFSNGLTFTLISISYEIVRVLEHLG